jgi:hypothetical protein
LIFFECFGNGYEWGGHPKACPSILPRLVFDVFGINLAAMIYVAMVFHVGQNRRGFFCPKVYKNVGRIRRKQDLPTKMGGVRCEKKASIFLEA